MKNIVRNLKKFRDMQISVSEMKEALQEAKATPLVEVSTKHIIKLLDCYRQKYIDDTFVIDWVNTIWFSEWFYYNSKQSDSIASVLNELEEIDEEGKTLTSERVSRFLQALKRNEEV